MSQRITPENKEKLFTQALHILGAPVRGVEIVETQMDTFFELSLSEYEEQVDNWMIESQWPSLFGLDIETQSLSRAFTTRSLDFETQFTYAYSKIVGLQANGPWELKQDFVELEHNQQTYVIPANREINEILWFTRSTLTDSIIDPYMGSFGGQSFGGFTGLAQVGMTGSFFLLPAFDLLLRMQDRHLKNKIISGDLTYKITAGPNGTKILHLMNVPGGRFDFGNLGRNGYKVYYWYYDTTDDMRDECLRNNKDIVKLPSDVKVQPLIWEELNTPAQNWVRKWFFAFCKEGLARVWGKYSGELKIPEAELKLDYQSLQTEAKDEKSKLIEELNKLLERMRPEKMLERKANEAENLNKSLKHRAMPAPIIII